MPEISSDIIIDAPAADVWQAAIDFSRYPDWNPLIAKVKGRARLGSELEMHYKQAGGKVRVVKRTVKTVAKYRELLCEAHYLFPGLCDGHYALILNEQGPDETRVIQRETFTGLFSFLYKRFSPVTAAGFEAMNEALRAQLEGEEEEEA